MRITFSDWEQPPAHPFTAGDKLFCKVTFLAEEDEQWTALGVEEGFSVFGELQEESYVLKTHIFELDVPLKRGESKTYDFLLPLTKAISYNGVNGSARPELNGFARPEGKNFPLLRSLITKNEWNRKTIPLTVLEGEGYRIKDGTYSLKPNLVKAPMMIFLVTVLIGVFASAFLMLNWWVSGLLFLAYLTVFGLRRWVQSGLGEIKLDVRQEPTDGFMAIVRTQEMAKPFNSITAGYEVVEEVMDRRENENRIRSTLLHRGIDTTLQDSGTTHRFKHSFPVDCPPSRNYGKLEIRWVYHIKIRAASWVVLDYEVDLPISRG